MQLIRNLLFGAGLVLAATSPRTRYNFNPGWKVVACEDPAGAETAAFDDSAWKGVTLPHAWNEDDAFRVDIGNLSTGIAWYRKTFSVPDLTSEKKVFLEFEGIRQAGEFYLNGKPIGISENGIMAFGFDVSDLIVPGEDNVLAARIDNSWEYREKATNTKFQWQDKNFYANYGGINKNVYLHVTGSLYQTLPLYSNLETVGTYVHARDINVDGKSAVITAESEIHNAYAEARTFTYKATVIDAKGKVVLELSSKNYTVEAGNTINASVSGTLKNIHLWSWGYGYLYDVVTTLLVNNSPVDTVTTRTGFRKTSFANGTFQLNNRALHLKGYAQRSTNEWPALGSSVPAWLSDFSNGLVLESHGSLIRWMHVTPWKQDIESLDRLGLLQAMPAGDSEGDVTGRRWEQRLEVMRDAVVYNRNNPSVVFYEGGNHGISEEHMEDMKAIRDQFDPHGGRASGSREMLNSTVAEYGGEMLYINKGRTIPLWQMEYSRDEGARKYWDDFSPPYHVDGTGEGVDAVYNRNQDSQAIENVVRWHEYYENRPGTGERVNAGGVNIVFSDSNTHHRGAENYRRSGEVDAVRLPKDGFFAHSVMWDCWTDVERSAVHIVGHWNYNDTVVKDVTVVSSAESVRLLLNGRSLGDGEREARFLFTFRDVKWESGRLEAVGYDENGKRGASDVRKTAGQPAALRLTSRVSPAGFKATGADIALVDVEVVDSHGQRCPTALHLVDFVLTGEAEWRGGIAIGDQENYILSKSLPVENGVNRVLLRSTTKAGKVTLKASAEGLKAASVSMKTEKVKVIGGLSLDFSSDKLPVDLSRGPTPKGESYTPTRKTLHVASITDSSNSSSLSFTVDDDEYTSYTSASGKNSWISFFLEEEAVVSQVVAKLSSFRTTSYALSVHVDGVVAWEGNTPVNLGYAVLDLKAAKGTNVTIVGTGGRQLKIVEVEFYEAL